MSGVTLGGGVPSQSYAPEKTEGVSKKTLLEKGLDVAKEKTAKGTLVGDHYVLAGGAAAVGTLAAGAAVVKIAGKVPAVDLALKALTSSGAGAVVNGGASYVLAEDAVKSFKNGKTVKGSVEAVASAGTGLAALELGAKQVGVDFRPLRATSEFVGKHAQSIGAGVAVVGGGVAIKSGIDDLKEGKKLKGGTKIAAGTVAIAGGAELVGREFGVKYMDRALTGPIKAVFGNNGVGVGVAGVAIAGAGVVAGYDGVKRLTKNKGIGNDLIGIAEVTGATTAVTGGASLVGVATKNQALAGVFKQNADVIGAVALGAGAVAMGKYTADSMKKNGVTLVNSATATGTGLATLGVLSIAGEKVGVKALASSFDKGWKPVAAAGLGLATYKLAKGAVREAKEGNAVNALGQGGAAVVTGGVSLAIAGKAFNIPFLSTAGEKMLSASAKVLEPVVRTAVEHPFATLGVVAVASGAGAYAYYHSKKD